jgi:predicted site-specific integrase-resolvase
MRNQRTSVDVLVDETAAAYLRGVSFSTQRRHRMAGIGPRPVISQGGKPRYRLSDIEREQGSEKQQAAAS